MATALLARKQTPMDHLRPLPMPNPLDASGVVTWVHLGDLHMKDEDAPNAADLRSIVADLNRDFGDGLAFVYLPGDNADDGSAASYAIVRKALEELVVPWFAIVGDHRRPRAVV